MTDPTSRALRLLGLLGHRAVWPGAELAAELGVVPRTLRRDIGRLRDLGYRVEAAPGQGGGYALARGQVLPPLLLDPDEAMAVSLALTSAAATGLAADAAAAGRALRKIDAVTPSAVRLRAQELRRGLELADAASEVPSETLRVCAEATRRRTRLRFEYLDRWGAASSRWVEPHRLIAQGRRWSLASFDLEKEAWRSFRLDRMSEVRPSEWRFAARDDAEEAIELLRSPMPLSDYRHQAVLRLHCPVEEAVGAYGGAGNEIRQLDDGWCELRAGADDSRRAAQWLAGVDHEFVVIGDASIRRAVRELGTRLGLAGGSGGAP